MGTKTRVIEQEAFTLDDGKIIDVLREETLARQYIPHRGALPIEDIQYDYYKSLEDLPIAYSLDPDQVPNVATAIQEATIRVPLFARQFSVSYMEWKRMAKSHESFDVRLRKRVIPNLALWEDYIAFAGESTFVNTNGSSFANTTNNTTQATTAFNFTTLALIVSTITDAAYQMIDAGIKVKQNPLVFGCTNDVYKKALKVLATDEERTGLDIANETLERLGGPGSQMVNFPNLGGTVSVGTDKNLSFSADTVNGVLMSVNPNHMEILHSPVARAETEPSVFDGKSAHIYERYVPVFYHQTANIYHGTCVIA
jgi:hypothetical protein